MILAFLIACGTGVSQSGHHWPETEPFLMASRDLPPGVTLTEDHLVGVELLPSDWNLDGVEQTGTLEDRIHQTVGRVVVERILLGELIRDDRLEHHSPAGPLLQTIPPGFRLVHLPEASTAEDGDYVTLVASEGCILAATVLIRALTAAGTRSSDDDPAVVRAGLLKPAVAMELARHRLAGPVTAVHSAFGATDTPREPCAPQIASP